MKKGIIGFSLFIFLFPIAIINAYGSIKGTSLGEFSSCDYYLIEDSSGDYTLAEWYGGSTAYEGNILVGELHSYGFKDLYNITRDNSTHVWIDDYLLSEDSAAEKLIDKCGYDRQISTYFDGGYGSYTPSYTTPTYSPPTPTASTCPINSSSSNGQCNCNSGYIVNPTKTACVPVPTCSQGYGLDSNNQCISNIQACKNVNNNDPNIIAVIGSDGKIGCNCTSGYTWNGNQCLTNSISSTNSSTDMDKNNQICREKFGNFGTYLGVMKFAGEPYCGCANGYHLSDNLLSCVSNITTESKGLVSDVKVSKPIITQPKVSKTIETQEKKEAVVMEIATKTSPSVIEVSTTTEKITPPNISLFRRISLWFGKWFR